VDSRKLFFCPPETAGGGWMKTDIDFTIKTLGKETHRSPLKDINFVDDNRKILYDVNYQKIKEQCASGGKSIVRNYGWHRDLWRIVSRYQQRHQIIVHAAPLSV
jgi:hypothetical protein